MYKGFLIESLSRDFVHRHAGLGEALVDARRPAVAQGLRRYSGENGELDADELVTQWFPEIKADVFISHSHLDKDLAHGLVGWLKEELGVTAFVDSLVWNSADELLRQIDEHHCVNDPQDEDEDGRKAKKSYNYRKRNLSTSHVHMMLAMAIAKMIDNCECLFFLSTPSSVSVSNTINDEGHTSSPWLFAELALSNLIRKRPLSRERQLRLQESSTVYDSVAMDSLDVSYTLPLKHLTRIGEKGLDKWRVRAGNDRGVSALDTLYKLF
ncbi:hypothetical protein [Stenotrophomonas maltophilia]|uniref:hypothetical protein n=1 Tax=Stenotrophomonas maltophilia TaxID=40324 RepID=UPI003BF8A389